MKILLKQNKRKELEKNEINVTIEYSNENAEVNDFIQYISNYDKQKNKIVVNKDNELIQIDSKDIILFYSDKKYNYCKTINGEYKIKSKLYEVEKMGKDFIRISKSCVVNINHVKCFDISETGRIVVKFNSDITEENVSRRRIKDVMNYLEERSI